MENMGRFEPKTVEIICLKPKNPDSECKKTSFDLTSKYFSSVCPGHNFPTSAMHLRRTHVKDFWFPKCGRVHVHKNPIDPE